ncbi:MAG: helix-turn-helix transcriptional regulator [Acidaminococcaceae bacterium]|uniref:helix-turn-helix domain-containing protein n=1 Tax=uncultured Phascolarctobacterium sp. TaxID=512296 RepID=UPI0025D4DBD6|nr:helix-turn-helix transcriptional regulator [uncultured Phascolarctobacterium sp.]MDO5380742.1 helix-turn-helix transcriptional regulator [Acidaminococcaceae bacterium]
MYDEKCLKNIGSNIRLLRTVCQLSQQDMAERIGISQTHLSNLEHNHSSVNLKLLLRIANVFECPLETLLDRKTAALWAEANCAEEAEKSSSDRITAAVNGQEQYSREEVRLLLKLLQLGKG